MAEKPTFPKILILDIETAPGQAYIWSMWDKFVPVERLIKPGRIIAVGCKWLGQKDIYYVDERAGRKLMLAVAAELMAEADAIVTYNGDKFDLPKLLGEMIINRIPLPPPVASIDLIKTVKKLGFMSNKLAFVLRMLGLSEKLKTDFGLWRACEEGDEKAWAKMQRYNTTDVRRTEKVFKIIRPAIRNYPMLTERLKQCPKCQGTRLQHRGYRYTKAYKIERYQCLKCGDWPDGKKTKKVEV